MPALDRALEVAVRAASWLVLPLSFLLFAQWPLREGIQAYSREANDLAQILFALYVAIAITAATRDGTHLAADTFARGYPAASRARILRFGGALVAIALALVVIAAGAPAAWASLLQLERFPETLNAGYFLVRIAALLLAVMVLGQGLLELFSPRDRGAA